MKIEICVLDLVMRILSSTFLIPCVSKQIKQEQLVTCPSSLFPPKELDIYGIIRHRHRYLVDAELGTVQFLEMDHCIHHPTQSPQNTPTLIR